MARLLGRVLLLSVRLAVKLRAAGYWTLVYGCCGLCALVALLRLCWNVLMRPTATFRWTVRESPPPCLNDTSLGTHCYVRIKVRARARPRARAEGTLQETQHRHSSLFFFPYSSYSTH